MRLTSTSRRRGGHAFVLDALDIAAEQVWAQTPGATTTASGAGSGFSFNDLERLLNEGGDSVQLVLLDELTPEPKLGSHARQTLMRLGLFKVHLVQVHKIG